MRRILVVGLGLVGCFADGSSTGSTEGTGESTMTVDTGSPTMTSTTSTDTSTSTSTTGATGSETGSSDGSETGSETGDTGTETDGPPACDPLQDIGCDPPVRIVAGHAHACVLDATGEVHCWGDGTNGRLGYANTDTIGDDEVPSSVGTVFVGGGPIAQLVGGGRHTCALLEGGNVRCWGHAFYGQLGYGNTAAIGDNETPNTAGDVPLGASAKRMCAGFNHTCAVTEPGGLRCWGSGGQGRLGYGNIESVGDDETPADVGDVDLGGREAADVACGQQHTCVLHTDGGVKCWGWADQGTLGYGNLDDLGDDEVPADYGDVELGGLAIHIAAGSSHTCAALEGGDLICWGKGELGRLGYASTLDVGDNETPASLQQSVDFGGLAIQPSLGANHSCVLTDADEVRCWGWGLYGQTGYGNTEDIGDDEPPAAAGAVQLGPVIPSQIALGAFFSCVLYEDDTIRCWGLNDFGQLGYGHTDSIGDDEVPADVGTVDY